MDETTRTDDAPGAADELTSWLRTTLRLWLAITTLVVAGNLGLLAAGGPAAYAPMIDVGPVSGLKITLAAVGFVWLGAGVLLGCLVRPSLRSRHGLLALVCFATLVLYANVLRERMEYPDSGDYMRAAFDLAEGRVMHERYLYPPLLASALALFAPLGRGAMRIALWSSNLIAVAAFAGLLHAALARYRFDGRLAALLAVGFMAVNVPVLRTLVYGQVNLHVAVFCLLALLLQPRRPIASAFALAVAVHLKASPVVLVLPFLHERNWRWLVAFAGWLLAIAAVLFALHGPQPFLTFLDNTRGLYGWSGPCFRENSIDSFLRSTAAVAGGPLTMLAEPVVRSLAKAPVLLAALWVALRTVRAGSFSGRQPGQVALDAWPALGLLMLLASPILWEHHPVFVAVSALVLVRKLEGAGEWAVFSLAYLFVFLLPTFDIYPWSYARLAGLLAILALLHRVAGRAGDGQAFDTLQRRCLTLR